MPRIKGYTLYFYSGSNSCITYFGIDSTNKKRVLAMGRAMAKLLQDHYRESLGWKIKITVKVEDYTPKSNQ